MLRVTTVKQLSTMRADSTKKQPVMHTPQGDTRFTLGITQTKPPRLTWKNTARSSRPKISFGGRQLRRPLSFSNGRTIWPVGTNAKCRDSPRYRRYRWIAEVTQTSSNRRE